MAVEFPTNLAALGVLIGSRSFKRCPRSTFKTQLWNIYGEQRGIEWLQDNDSSLYMHYVIKAWWRICTPLNGVDINSDNGLAPIKRQAITWTNVDFMPIRLWDRWHLNQNTIIFFPLNTLVGQFFQVSLCWTFSVSNILTTDEMPCVPRLQFRNADNFDLYSPAMVSILLLIFRIGTFQELFTVF